MKLLRESVLVLALGLTLSSATAPGEPTMTVRRGAYPWHAWDNPVYKQHFTWPEFRKKVAELNNLPNTEKAFRHLARGTELRIPALPGSGASASEIAKAKADQRELDKLEFRSVEDAYKAEVKRLKDALALSYTSLYRNVWFWVGVLGALLIGAALMYFLGAKYLDWSGGSRLQEVERENNRLNAALAARDSEIEKIRLEVQQLRRESDARDHFIGKYTEVYDLPHDIGSFKGKHNRIYLLRREPMDGEPTVLVWNGTQYIPVKRKNLNKFFDDHKTNVEMMEFYGIHPGEQITRRMRTGTNG